MPEQSKPSFTLEIVVATVVGATLGLWLDNVVIGSGVGIGLGAVLSVLKMTRSGKQK